MEMHLSSLFTLKDKNLDNDLFQSEIFRDHLPLHAYLQCNKSDSSEVVVGKYASLTSMMSFYNELRAISENHYKDEYGPKAISQKRAVPISFDNFYSFIKHYPSGNDAPMELIVRIAIEEYETIRLIGMNLNKLLRRERQLVSIDKVQQVDNQCIRWIARQPGKTAAQKAGPKQQIKAVVRQENYNTLENRVYKHFLELVISEATSYIRNNGNHFPDSNNLKKVMKLKRLCMSILLIPEIEGVGRIYSLPKPNYVLQNNPRYSTVWNLYVQLISKQKMIEILWENRHRVFREFALHAFLAIEHHHKGQYGKPSFSHYFWINKFPTEEGKFFCDSNPIYYEVFKDETTDQIRASFFDEDPRFSYYWLDVNEGRHSQKLGVAYVPDTVSSIMIDDNRRNLIIAESKVELSFASSMPSASPSKHFFINLENTYDAMLPSYIFKSIEESLR